mmetsp:Transcript_4977/g.8087  ORF Transcript_4977/g.8087 Transcript_4977/m.8087 type:complete len:222 (-) Transcript_4977:199-864(-)
MPHCSRDTFAPLFPVHFDTPLQVRGPLKRITAMLAFPLASKDPMKDFAAVISASQPSFPRLPLPSISKMISREALHAKGLAISGVEHLCILHCLYCNLFSDHSSAHSPAPSDSFVMNFNRFRVPPSQSFEQPDHFVQSDSSQSFSHAAMLQALLSEVFPHGLPPYFMATFTSRKRCVTPPPHWALHLLHPLHSFKEQSTGQGALLQLRMAAKGKHFEPPSG